MFKTSFLILRKLCKSDLQCFQTFEIAVCFGTFSLWGNFYSDDAHHSNYCELFLNHPSFHCYHCLNKIYSVFKPFEIAVCFGTLVFVAVLFYTFWHLRNFYSGDTHHSNYCELCKKSSFLPLRSVCKSDLQWFKIFRRCSLFRHIWLLRNFYSGDAHYANNGKHSLNHHFRHTAHSVYKIYSVFKLFEIAVCLHILAFTKFLLRWWPPCSLYQIKFTSSSSTFRKLCI